MESNHDDRLLVAVDHDLGTSSVDTDENDVFLGGIGAKSAAYQGV